MARTRPGRGKGWGWKSRAAAGRPAAKLPPAHESAQKDQALWRRQKLMIGAAGRDGRMHLFFPSRLRRIRRADMGDANPARCGGLMRGARRRGVRPFGSLAASCANATCCCPPSPPRTLANIVHHGCSPPLSVSSHIPVDTATNAERVGSAISRTPPPPSLLCQTRPSPGLPQH